MDVLWAAQIVLGFVLVVLAGGAGIMLFLISSNSGSFLWDYRITKTHLELLLLGRWPVRRVPLWEVLTVELLDRGGGVDSIMFNTQLMLTRPFLALVGKFESWQKSWSGLALLVERTGGRQVLLTPDDPTNFRHELASAVQHARRRYRIG